MSKTLLKIKTENGVVKCVEENNKEIKFYIGPKGVYDENYEFSTSDKEQYKDEKFLFCGTLFEVREEYHILYKNKDYIIYKRNVSNGRYYLEIEKIADVSSDNIKWDYTKINLRLLV